MTKQLFNAFGKKTFIYLATALFFMSASTVNAALPGLTETAKVADISYEGVKDQFLVFKFDYKNEAAKPFELQIKNEENSILFAKKYDANPLSTKIFFSELPSDCKLTFIILRGKEEVSQSFSINTNFKTVQELVVKGDTK